MVGATRSSGARRPTVRFAYLRAGRAEAGVGLAEQAGAGAEGRGCAGVGRVPEKPPRLGRRRVPKQTLRHRKGPVFNRKYQIYSTGRQELANIQHKQGVPNIQHSVI